MKYLSAILILTGIFLWGWLFFRGCENPACRTLGVYTHRVSTISDYKDYVAGVDLYTRHRAASLRFECDVLREEMTRVLRESMVNDADLNLTGKVRDEVTRLGLLGASRKGRVLHFTNDVTVGGEGLDAWAVQITAMVAKDPDNREDGWAAAAIRRLFDQVVLHAGDREVGVPVRSDARSRCD